jgi:hypothetical protein
MRANPSPSGRVQRVTLNDGEPLNPGKIVNKNQIVNK